MNPMSGTQYPSCTETALRYYGTVPRRISMRALILLFTLFLGLPAAAQPIAEQPDFDSFIEHMEEEHDFNPRRLRALFEDLEVREDIIADIEEPAESKPWYRYRRIFLTDERIETGADFWDEHRETLERAREEYGVDPAVVVGILGVETYFGRREGDDPLLESLGTLAFAYPPRADFFRGELEEFLLMAREEQLEPAELIGSYAGAMGRPQFMASSFRAFAVDFDSDGRRDLWNSWPDAIGSVASYLADHGWEAGEPLLHRLPDEVDAPLEELADEGLKPSFKVAELREEGLELDGLDDDREAAVVRLEQEEGHDHWLGFNNFYAITRYNHSALYAMAVHQLGEAIREEAEG